MDNDSMKAATAALVSQKENNPPLAGNERNRSTEKGIIATKAESSPASTTQLQIGVPKNHDPLKARNMASQHPNQKALDQMQLLEKFRKLRQWQQQQQESMFRQQQQQMETLKMEQTKLQSILAAQKRLDEQRNVASPPQQPPHTVITSEQQYVRKETTLFGQKQLPQNPAAEPHVLLNTKGRTAVELNSNGANPAVLPRSLPASSLLSAPNIESVVLNQVELPGATSRHLAVQSVLEQQDASQISQFSSQLQVLHGESLEGSVASFNRTMYPMMWNSSNYRLPLGAIPLSSITDQMSSQGLGDIPQMDLGSTNSNMPPFSMGAGFGESTEISNKAPGLTQVLERLWEHIPGLENTSDVESQGDNNSEVDAMSGIYPLWESESEVGGSELDEGKENEWEEESEPEEELAEESLCEERNTTVIENQPDEKTQMTEEEENLSITGDDERRPIKPGIGGPSSARTFEELLEEQLKLDEASRASPTKNAKQKPQRTFLRKGQGLARFKGKSASSKPTGPAQESTGQAAVPQLRKAKKGVAPPPGTSQANNRQNGQNDGPTTQGRVTRKIASKSLQVIPEPVQDPALGKHLPHEPSALNTHATNLPRTVTTAAITKTLLALPRTEVSNSAGMTNSIDASFQMRLREWEENQEIEEEELEEFELLEEAAANASFSSNSSVVVKVLAKARGQAPPDTKGVIKGPSAYSVEDRGGVLSPVDTGYGSGEGKVVLSEETEETTLTRDRQQGPLNNDSDDEDSDVTLQEMSLDSALDLADSEEDKRRTVYRQQQTEHLEEKAPSYPASTSSLAIEEDFNDEETWGEIKTQAWTKSNNNANNDDDSDDDDSDVTISDIFPLVSSTPPANLKGVQSKRGENQTDWPDGMVTSTPPTSALVTKLFPQLKPKQKSVVQQPQQESTTEPVEAHALSIEGSLQAVQSKAVREKLKELEIEIDKFRVENTALAKMRTEREEGLKKLQTEIAAFEKQKTEELERLETFREEELRKLRREKRVFEKYQKAARTIPDKKERDEIEGLRGQVTELQEELKRRESRWSAASTRYRQKIESLEQQNKELQEELKLLEQYRLQQWREEEEHLKAKEADDTKPKKPFQRKTAKATEEETGPRLPPCHGSPPNKPTFIEAIVKSTPDIFSPDDRSLALNVDVNNNKSAGLGTEALSNPGDKSPEVLAATNIGDSSRENQRPKRSPRRRSKTPDSSEKKRKNVRFKDDERMDQSAPGEGSNLADLEGMSEKQEILHADGKVEKLNSDGSRVISFANGTRKDISADGQTVTVTFFNGDIKQILPDQRVIYYYSDVQTTHTTYSDGLEVLQFPSKQIEKHYRNGTKEIIFPDQTIKYLYPNGAEECVFSDGTIQRVSVEGERTIEFPNGQRETHTKYFKKREYPDGTVKTVYPDGRTETRYATGRVRVKDRDGRVLVDTADQNR